ncbi:hypothetical protein EV121DRAFT_262734 [Schizophyllum commune]
MGTGKKAQRHAKQQQLRSRNTRSSKGRVISPSDPENNGRLLTEQLRGLGLYAADTLGDGNCLFRALSDQLYGSPSRHALLRARVCDWIEAHGERYAPFVEDERGLEAHLRCMRENGTYGGHLELSAFAHMTGKNVKVIQPALVYVIAANAMDDSAPEASTSTAEQQPDEGADGPLSGREKRQARRERKRTEKDTLPAPTPDPNEGEVPDTVYVAYHDWEHFSSIRNLRGPHSGLPMVQEIRAEPEPTTPATPKKKVPRVKLKLSNPSTPASSSKPPSTVVAPPPSIAPSSIASLAQSSLNLASPAQVPLPISRSPSPLHSRSPKRSFDESSLSSLEETENGADTKRRRPSPLAPLPTEDTEDTPELSAPGSASSRESSAFSSSLSELTTEEEEEEVEEEPPAPPSPPPVPLTQRQRKKLGLPKQRPGQRSAGTIVIPGGRFKRQQPVAVAAPDEEWVRNGTGRVDVRGFRELKI